MSASIAGREAGGGVQSASHSSRSSPVASSIPRRTEYPLPRLLSLRSRRMRESRRKGAIRCPVRSSLALSTTRISQSAPRASSARTTAGTTVVISSCSLKTGMTTDIDRGIGTVYGRPGRGARPAATPTITSPLEPEAYRAQYELEDAHWWFAGRRAVIWALLRRAGVAGGVGMLDAGGG